MVSSTKFKKELEEFFKKYPENEPVKLDEQFREDVESICNGLSLVEISYSNINAESRMHSIVDYASKIMMHFQKADILEPLNNTYFILYLKISQLIGNLKFIIISELVDDGFEILNSAFLFDLKKEQYICDSYKSKLDDFKKNCSEEEVQTINEHFTYFIFEFLKTLSKLTGKGKILDKYIKLLLKVADLRILIENIHIISFYISKTEKIHILQIITNFCVDKNFNFKNCGFVKSSDKDFKFEICAISYFTLQHICHYLELQKMHQTSQILSSFTIEDIISTIDSVTFNPKIEKCCEESVDLIILKAWKKIKVVPSQEIKKCLDILGLLLNSLSNNQLQNCSFTIILLSMISEFMATDLDQPTLISLIDLVIGYLNISKLPPNFKAVYYVYKIYQKLKSDIELEIKVIDLCKSLSTNLHRHHPYIQIDVESVITNGDDWDDKSIIVSYFLNNYLKKIEDGALKKLFYTLNEHVLLSTQYLPKKNARLIFPYSVSLNFSILNKDEDCLFNNLAVLDDYLSIFFSENQTIGFEDRKSFLTIILRHYENISQSLPDNFLFKCWEYSLNPQNADIDITKELLQLCSSKNLSNFIDILKVETMKIFESEELVGNDDFYLYIHKLWHSLLNMQFIKQKKKVRKDQVNHFCFILNRTFLFNKNKIKNEQSLILLLRLVSSLLKLPWINKITLMNCSLRIITIIEKCPNLNNIQPLTEAAELLIVLYKCPNNSIKPLLGLYVTTFANLVKKCWLFICCKKKMKECMKNLIIPFHKLEKCSSLFKQNKNDFEIICRYIIEDLVELISLRSNLRDGFMRHYYNIIFNLMDVCSSEEMKQLMLNIQGPALLILRNAYKEYRSSVRFTGRL